LREEWVAESSSCCNALFRCCDEHLEHEVLRRGSDIIPPAERREKRERENREREERERSVRKIDPLRLGTYQGDGKSTRVVFFGSLLRLTMLLPLPPMSLALVLLLLWEPSLSGSAFALRLLPPLVWLCSATLASEPPCVYIGSKMLSSMPTSDEASGLGP
jgi:hypothetical protein